MTETVCVRRDLGKKKGKWLVRVVIILVLPVHPLPPNIPVLPVPSPTTDFSYPPPNATATSATLTFFHKSALSATLLARLVVEIQKKIV